MGFLKNSFIKTDFLQRKDSISMTKADKYLVADIHNILENGYKDVNPRPRYEDGTPAYTISVNHVVRKYDLSKGEFPICTLRRQAWKTGMELPGGIPGTSGTARSARDTAPPLSATT